MLKKKHRLAKTTDIKKTFMRGRVFFNPSFKIHFLKSTDLSLRQGRFTVVVPLIVSKKAVARNRLKRMVREFIRKNVKHFASGDYVVEIRPRALLITKHQVLAELKKLLLTKQLLTDEPFP